jgi:hypothetical protein
MHIFDIGLAETLTSDKGRIAQVVEHLKQFVDIVGFVFVTQIDVADASQKILLIITERGCGRFSR